ncbi:hypothetical protein L6452_18598 [Arctium lappa]|uniref:Uncharacterized protein n=1 Tax=Arctium lappa TaxID=4217 RepID=A0ACB9C6Q9_ARCLA|nr:hypothetical protein L6452_18598 [Arctium lappa]
MMLIIPIVLLILPYPGFCDLNFSFPSFDSSSCDEDGDFICMGSVVSRNGSLIITPVDDERKMNGKNSSVNLIGRVLYKTPVVAWPASFSTTFTIRIVNDPDSALFGDGMAFVIAQDDRPSPPQSYGSYLGILGPSTEGGVVHQLAVELDTFMNEYESDPDDNHIAIDTISIRDPVVVKSLEKTGIDLKSGRDITVQIIYDGWDKILRIFVAYTGEPLVEFIKKRIVMKKTVPRQVYIGFTGSTATARESHEILNWNFTLFVLPEGSLKTAIGLSKREAFLVIILPILFGISILAAAIFPFAIRAFRQNKQRKQRHCEIQNLSLNAANAPKVFRYRTLSKATKNFSKDKLLGTGGFGSVFKGQLSDPPKTVAVKKVSATSTQGEKEYLAEICTIGRLKHKNLVQLEGELLNCVDRNLDEKYNVDQVTRTLMVGLACLHPGSRFRPCMRKVVQVLLNPDEPLMSLPASRPLVVSLSFNSSTVSSVGTDSGGSMQSLPEEMTITRNPSCSDET